MLEEKFDLNLKPYESQTINIQRLRIYGHPGEEFFVRFLVSRREGQDYKFEGRRVAYEEFKLDWPSEEKKPFVSEKPLEFSAIRQCVYNENFTIAFSELTGGLSSFVYKGVELLKGELHDNFWRAPTLNDEVDSWALPRWKKAGLQHLTAKTGGLHFERLDAKTVSVNAAVEYYDGMGQLQIVVNKVYLIDGEGNVHGPVANRGQQGVSH